MKKGQRLWTRSELILVINLYCKLPFGRMHKTNPEVILLSVLIQRTPSSVAYKLVNFASLDPSLKARGIQGASNTSKLDRKVWNEFYENWEELSFESEKLRAEIENKSVENTFKLSEESLIVEGITRESLVKTRVNQSFFRSSILASYNNTCCVTGIKKPELLIAGHIKPWSVDRKNRLNPRNGIAINALHDKAFESGLMTITPDYKIKISSSIITDITDDILKNYFLKYDGKEIILPSKFLPDENFLIYHNNECFKK
ncbi:HNH endonuclease [Leeuwenhoekiella polynyae]|uniref:Putative restriction endonuclease n=1 Tax=Leeuwenhoekiella polynyae TaxID=1550906 RepID=A0A4Q0NS23_9FLAO|nr:HNH endonuclease [Leeuwenhoekiella polynyae]RXG13653.1 putative restriction endonuclease [Leeuwenhoekiella polynyae]